MTHCQTAQESACQAISIITKDRWSSIETAGVIAVCIKQLIGIKSPTKRDFLLHMEIFSKFSMMKVLQSGSNHAEEMKE